MLQGEGLADWEPGGARGVEGTQNKDQNNVLIWTERKQSGCKGSTQDRNAESRAKSHFPQSASVSTDFLISSLGIFTDLTAERNKTHFLQEL